MSIDSGAPEPREWLLADAGIIVRGTVRSCGDQPVVLIHDSGPEDDLDRWDALPDLLCHDGYQVVAVDLPGHGLSDGKPEEVMTREAVRAVMDDAERETGRTPMVVAAGNGIIPVVGVASSGGSLRALVAISPPGSVIPPGTCPKLVFVGARDNASREAADRFLRLAQGWSLVSSFGTENQSHALLDSRHGQAICTQIMAFLRDYRKNRISSRGRQENPPRSA